MNWQEDDLPMYDPAEEESKPIRLYNEDDEDFDDTDYEWKYGDIKE